MKKTDKEILALIDRLNGKYKVGPNGEYGERDFNKAIFIPPIAKEAAKVIQDLLDEQRWIPVSERLPEPGKRVEVYSPQYAEDHYMRVRHIDGQFVKTIEATHWRYVTPPKED